MSEEIMTDGTVGKSFAIIESNRINCSAPTDGFMRSFTALFRKHKNVYKLFFAMTKKLNKFFSISTAILVLYSTADDRLKVIAIRRPNYAREGLTLTLPQKDSLLYDVFKNATPHIEHFPADFKGNFIEQKLLFDSHIKSLVICPIKYEGSALGLVCFTSPTVYAFEMFEEGLADALIEQFGTIIDREKNKLNV